MRIAIVEDDPKESDRLVKYLSNNTDGSTTIKVFPDGESFLAAWDYNHYDLIILDMFMNKILGIDVARQIRKKNKEVCLVFCTTSNEFAAESYEVDARYYLHKPFSEEQVKGMLNRLNLETLKQSLSIMLPNGKRVLLNNILYTECSGHVITIHSKYGDNISLRMTQQSVETLLCVHPQFICCYKGIIVNFNAVLSMNDGVFHMSDDSTIPISRRKLKEIKDAYADFQFQLLRTR